MYRRQQTRLPSVYEARNLFGTPGEGTSNHPEVNRGGAPGTGASVQPPATERNRQVVPTPHVPTPPGHYSNPLDNIVIAASRLAALPIEGTSPMAMEARRAKELLDTALTQQQAYSYSRERIHSIPCHSRSYTRHWDESEVSSSERRRHRHRQDNPTGDRKSTRLNSSHVRKSRMPSSA